jgi:AraC-like DNA-binding protein
LEKSDKTSFLPAAPARLRSRKIRPAPVLSPFVDHVRVVSHVPGGAPYERLPDGAVELVVRAADAGYSINVVGTRLSPLHKPSDAHDESFLVRFKAGGAYPFFGVPVAELTDDVVPVASLSAAVDTALQRALDAPTTLERAAAVQGALAGALAAPAFEPASVPMVRRALRLLAASPELPRVAELATRLGVSERHLRRSFDDVVGLSPKAYLRVVRFQRAFKGARASPAESWARIAQFHGFYDQAHMISEFRALSGRTPSALRRPRPAGSAG